MRSNNEIICSNAGQIYWKEPVFPALRGLMKAALCVTLGLFGACLTTTQAAEPVGPQQVITLLQQAGYGEVRDLEYDDGLWEAEIRRPYGLWDEVSVDPATGEIFDLRGNRKVLSMRDLLAKLEGQGYRAFTDIDRDAGVWEVEATDPQGRRVDLKVSGYDGRILNSKFDD